MATRPSADNNNGETMLHTKLIGRTTLALLIAIFSGVNLAAKAAQEAELSSRNNGSAPDEPADDNESIYPSAHMWRSLTLSHGITRHHYREPDPLGRVDPLDSETGSIPTTQATLRWRGQLAQAIPELTLQYSL